MKNAPLVSFASLICAFVFSDIRILMQRKYKNQYINKKNAKSAEEIFTLQPMCWKVHTCFDFLECFLRFVSDKQVPLWL